MLIATVPPPPHFPTRGEPHRLDVMAPHMLRLDLASRPDIEHLCIGGIQSMLVTFQHNTDR